MVLLEVDADGISSVELKGDTPWPIDVDRIARWAEAVQGVEVEPRQVHFLGALRHIQSIQAHEDALLHLGVDLAGFSRLEQVRQRLALERPDHMLCKRSAYISSSGMQGGRFPCLRSTWPNSCLGGRLCLYPPAGVPPNREMPYSSRFSSRNAATP